MMSFQLAYHLLLFRCFQIVICLTFQLGCNHLGITDMSLTVMRLKSLTKEQRVVEGPLLDCQAVNSDG